MTHLHIFALNEPVTVSHTNLTRQKGEAPALPPLAQWLGLETLDTDLIELFPISDLGGMPLSDYIQLAFTPETGIPSDIRTRLDALEGAVLLVPDTAMTGDPKAGAHATKVAEIPLAQPDNTATLPKADISAPQAPVLTPAPERERTPPIAFFALLGIAVFALIVILFGWR